jgi:hypothetical protein
MSINLNTKNSISIENPMLIHYLVRKFESRQNSLDNLKKTLNSITSLEDYYINKKPTINFIDELIEDFKQAVFAMKALLTENKALSLSNDYKEETIAKQITENVYLSNENEDLKKENKGIIKQNNLKSPKRDFFKYQVSKSKQFSNAMKNIEFEKKRLKTAVRLHFKNSRNKIPEKKNNNTLNYSNNYNNSNSEIINQIINNEEILNILNQKLGKDVIKKLLDPNCPRDYYENVEKIITDNNLNNEVLISNLKVPIRLKNTIQAKVNLPKSNRRVNSFSHRTNNKDKEKKFFDNSTNPYGGYFEKPKYLGQQKYYSKNINSLNY